MLTVHLILFFFLGFGSDRNNFLPVGVSESSALFNHPGERYISLGDINIGATLFVTCEGCQSEELVTNEKNYEIINYIVEILNKNRTLPRGLRLGFAVVDNHADPTTAMLQATSFMPQTCAGPADGVYDVVAVVGAEYTSIAKSISLMLGPARVPLISYFATGDRLSDKTKYPYFMRTVPPDRYQFKAISKFIAQSGWNVASLVYHSDDYGRNAAELVKLNFNKDGICLAQRIGVPVTFTEDDIERVSTSLVTNHDSVRVVVMILNKYNLGAEILKRTSAQVPIGTFVWIFSDGISLKNLITARRYAAGAFGVTPHGYTVPEFEDYYSNLTLSSASSPGFPVAYAKAWGCSGNACQKNKPIGMGEKYDTTPMTGADHLMDSVMLVARAVARILKNSSCRASNPRDCVTASNLIEELKATSEYGYSGPISFDSKNDRKGKFSIRQYDGNSIGWKVADFDTTTEQLTPLTMEKWHYHSLKVGESRLMANCTPPCGPRDTKQVHTRTCCWRCLTCRPNERIVGDRCEPCPMFAWPDAKTNFTTCVRLPLVVTGLRRHNYYFYVVYLSVAVVALLVCVAVLAFFVYNRNTPVIKASSRELSFVMLFALALGYCTVIVYALEYNATRTFCISFFVLYCASFNLIYAPLFLRTVRIYWIFAFPFDVFMGFSHKLLSGTYQLMYTLVLFLVQVSLCVVGIVSKQHWVSLEQKPKMMLVEQTCLFPVLGFSLFLSYNLLLVVVCALLAFKTRRLPHNFNESLFIAMCLCSSIILWVVSIVVIVLASHESTKHMYMGMTLLSNHSVALVFLFLSKVYGVLHNNNAGRMRGGVMVRITEGKVSTLTSASQKGTGMMYLRPPPTPGVPTVSLPVPLRKPGESTSVDQRSQSFTFENKKLE